MALSATVDFEESGFPPFFEIASAANVLRHDSRATSVKTLATRLTRD